MNNKVSKLLLDNPALKDISPEKLKFLLEFSAQGKQSSTKDMMAMLMAAKASASDKGVEFSSDEMNLLMEILKQNMSEEERRKADLIISMFKKNKK